MTKEERIAKVQEMIDAPSCCADLKEAGKAYLAAVGTDKEAEAPVNTDSSQPQETDSDKAETGEAEKAATDEAALGTE